MARKMKDSGIEWIGEIPENWKRTELIHLLRDKITDGPHETPVYAESGIPFISVDSLNSTKYVDLSVCKRFISKEQYDTYCKKTIVEEGDVLFTKAATIGKTAIAGNEEYMVWSPIAIIKPNYDIADNNYLYYVLNCSGLITYVSFLGSMNTQINVGMRELEKAYVPFPPLSEQCRIANFLDCKCAGIDLVIEQTRSSIEEYKKLKQAVITQAVTKGVRGDRPMKDGGIEWVKSVPCEWEIIPSKYLFADSNLRRLPEDKQMTASQQYGIISQSDYMERTGAKVVFANKGLDDWKHVDPFDFVISLRSFQGGLEMSEVSGCVTWHYIVLKACREIYPYFYKWLFKSDLYIKALQRTCNFIRDGQDLRYSNFIQVPLFIPTLKEQREIAEYLNKKCSEIDQLIGKKEDFIIELEKYKKSMIYEYATGKKRAPIRC